MIDFTVYKSCWCRVVIIDELQGPAVARADRLAFADELLNRQDGIGGDLAAFLSAPAGRVGLGAAADVHFVTAAGAERPIDEAGILAAADYITSKLDRTSGDGRSVELRSGGQNAAAGVYSIERRAPLTADLSQRYAVNLGELRREAAFSAWESAGYGEGRDYLRVHSDGVALKLRDGVIRGRLDAFLVSLGEPHLVLFSGDDLPESDHLDSRDQFINDLLESCFPDVEAPDPHEARASARILEAVGRYFRTPNQNGHTLAGVIAARAVEPGSFRYMAYDCSSDGRAASTGTAATVTGALAVTLGLCQPPVLARSSSPLLGSPSPYAGGLLATISHNHDGWIFEGIVRQLFTGRW